MIYIYNITVPPKFQVVGIEDKQVLSSRAINFVVEFESKTSITQEDVEHAEVALQGKPIPSETELIRCVKHIARSCLEESKPMGDQLYVLRPHFPKVKAAVVLDGKISWNQK